MISPVPVSENSNMLPHGTRSAAMPRRTIAPTCSTSARTVIAMPTRSNRDPRRPEPVLAGASTRSRTTVPPCTVATVLACCCRTVVATAVPSAPTVTSPDRLAMSSANEMNATTYTAMAE